MSHMNHVERKTQAILKHKILNPFKVLDHNNDEIGACFPYIRHFQKPCESSGTAREAGLLHGLNAGSTLTSMDVQQLEQTALYAYVPPERTMLLRLYKT
jgi:hypothetical protein